MRRPPTRRRSSNRQAAPADVPLPAHDYTSGTRVRSRRSHRVVPPPRRGAVRHGARAAGRQRPRGARCVGFQFLRERVRFPADPHNRETGARPVERWPPLARSPHHSASAPPDAATPLPHERVAVAHEMLPAVDIEQLSVQQVSLSLRDDAGRQNCPHLSIRLPDLVKPGSSLSRQRRRASSSLPSSSALARLIDVQAQFSLSPSR